MMERTHMSERGGSVESREGAPTGPVSRWRGGEGGRGGEITAQRASREPSGCRSICAARERKLLSKAGGLGVPLRSLRPPVRGVRVRPRWPLSEEMHVWPYVMHMQVGSDGLSA